MITGFGYHKPGRNANLNLHRFYSLDSSFQNVLLAVPIDSILVAVAFVAVAFVAVATVAVAMPVVAVAIVVAVKPVVVAIAVVAIAVVVKPVAVAAFFVEE